MKPELLAPAGNYAQLKAAVYNGADAVYLGLDNFNARRKADNFSRDNAGEVIDFCHLYGVKVYIAVNTLVKSDELADAEKLITACAAAGADAFIATDLAVIKLIRQNTDLPIHLSTQAGVCNLEGAVYAHKLGADRVILARETKLEDIKLIKEKVNLELECFVHGALCVAFSGKCLFSSAVNGNSGNRGLCLQPCRLKYKCGENSGYLLSTSDLCLLDKLDKLSDAGICSFKIEGRARSAEYVAEAVSVYRKAIDNGFKPQGADYDRLNKVFNRGGGTCGYNFGERENNLMSTAVQGHSGLNIGTVISTDKKKKEAHIATDFPLQEGDGYKLIMNGLEVGGGEVKIISKTNKGYILLLEAEEGCGFNITKDSALMLRTEKTVRRLPVKFEFSVEGGYPILKAFCKGYSAQVRGCMPLTEARTARLTLDEITDAMEKCGGTDFCFDGVSASGYEGKFIVKSALNALRRDTLAALRETMILGYNRAKIKRKNQNSIENIIDFNQINNTSVYVELSDAAQADRVDASVIIYSPQQYSVDASKKFLDAAQRKGTEVYLRLTANANGKDIKLFRSILNSLPFCGIYADNLYSVQLACEYGLKVFAGMGLNIYNPAALSSIANLSHYLASPELTVKELAAFANPAVFAYGYLPLMQLTHCPVRLNFGGDCLHCVHDGRLTYTDKNGFNFGVRRVKADSCYFILNNSVITDISKKIDEIPFKYYLDMVQLPSSEAERVLESFINKKPLNTKNYTCGHFFRGVK